MDDVSTTRYLTGKMLYHITRAPSSPFPFILAQYCRYTKHLLVPGRLDPRIQIPSVFKHGIRSVVESVTRGNKADFVTGATRHVPLTAI